MTEKISGAPAEKLTGKALYEELSVLRTTALQTARRCSELTIPSLIPPEGTNSTTKLSSPYQSLGAYGVNNLSAKLLLALYPPGNTFFRYILPEAVAEEAKAALPPEAQQELEKKLAAAENRALQRFETSTIRPQKAEALMHLIVAGNVLTKFESLDKFRMYRLDQYVVRRDASGHPLDAVVKECVTPSALSQEVKDACGVKKNSEKIDVYTVVAWERGRCKWHQEINDRRVPDSDGDAPLAVAPWNPLRWKAIPNSDYGRGHCEEYLGDLISLEGLSQAMVEFAAMAAKVVFLVSPNSQTDIGDVNRAQSGEAVVGQEGDITVVQMEKYADFQVVERMVARLEERLSRAFLLQSGLVRDAERVTAEEIRGTAQELEDTLGGVYTVLAQEEQMPFIRRLLHVLTNAGELPRLPEGAVEPVVVTGFQALGRNHSLNKLRGAINDLHALFGPEGTLKLLQGTNVASRILLGWGVEKASDVVKSAEQMEQEEAAAQQAAMMQTLMDKGTAPIVKGVVDNNK